MKEVKNPGLESRKLLLRRIKDYYLSNQKKYEPKDKNSCAVLDAVCTNPELGESQGYIPVFAEGELTQVFYNYHTGESFVAINTDDDYTVLNDTYSHVSTFAANIALNIGLCYKIFTKECEIIEDPELSEALANEAATLRKYLYGKMKLYTY